MASAKETNLPYPSLVQWWTTKFGDDCTTYNEIEKDPYLRERIKPTDGFKTVIDGYKYTVKFYEAGKVYIFKKKVQAGYKLDTERQNRTKDMVQEIPNFDHSNRSIILNWLDLMNTFINENRKILGFKKVLFDEFSSEDEWEVFYLHPIVVLEDEPYLILIKQSDNDKYSQESDGIERKTDERKDDFTNKDASHEKNSTLESGEHEQ